MGDKVPQMVSGLGMAMRFISLLCEGIRKRKGHDELLHLLTSERGHDNLEKVIDYIVSLEWSIPKSLILKMTREESINAYGGNHLESDLHFFWSPALTKLKIPHVLFISEQNYDQSEVAVEDQPLELLREQVNGKKIECGSLITWESKQAIPGYLC